MSVMVGGCSTTKEATEDIKKICLDVKHLIEEKAGRTFEIFEARNYKQQVVAGMNYFVQIHVGNEEYIHARIYQPLGSDAPLSLASIKGDMTKDNDIEYF